jgi:hypothetical protein
MKIKSAVFCLIALLLSGSALAMMRMPDTPEGRRALWIEKQQEITQLQEDLVAAQQALKVLPDKGEVEVDPDNVRADIAKVQAEADAIVPIARQAKDEWVKNREQLLMSPQQRVAAIGGAAVSAVKAAVSPSIVPAEHAAPSPEWGGAGEPPPPPSSSWITPQKKLALGAAGIIALGVLFKKLPEWNKNRIKRILKEHGKKLSDLDPAEQDLFASASYARFNPTGSFFLQEAVLDMPEDTDLRDELWPILNHVYYGKKRVSRKQARELRKLYDEAKELMIVD